jgi:hypothetical protein
MEHDGNLCGKESYLSIIGNHFKDKLNLALAQLGGTGYLIHGPALTGKP